VAPKIVLPVSTHAAYLKNMARDNASSYGKTCSFCTCGIGNNEEHLPYV